MPSLTRFLLPGVLVAVALLTGCAPATTTDGGGGAGGEGASGGGGAAGGSAATDAVSCDGVATAGWELFVDPRLAVDPVSDVAPLTTAGETIAFTDTAPVGFTTYSYSLGYIDDAGTVFPNDAAIFVGAESTNAFALEGPVVPSGVDGGPYAGIVQIEATDDSGTAVLARICVALAASD